MWRTGIALALSPPRLGNTPPTSTTWALLAEPAAVPAARMFVQKHLAGLLDVGTCSDAVIVTSELVANAVAASITGSAIELRLRADRDSSCIEVFDHSEETPQRRCADELDEGGRGLLLVEELTRRWGWHPVSGGKVVWAEL